MTRSPVRGFTPWRAFRCWGANLPKPVNVTDSPSTNVSCTESRNASTAEAASRFERPLLDATRSTNSALVTATALSSYVACADWVGTVTAWSESTQPSGFGHSSRTREVLHGEERPKPDRHAGERIHSALLPVDHADGRPALEPRLAERLDRGHRGAARRDHVLDEADPLPRLVDPLDPVG